MAQLIILVANVLTLLLLARVVISWVAPLSTNPLVLLVYRLTEPVLAPIRNLLPPMGGMDFSPVVVLLGVQVLENVLLRLL